MAANGFASPASMESVRVVECGAWVNQEQAQGDIRTDVNIEVSLPVVVEQAERLRVVDVFVGVSASFSDNGATPTPRGTFKVKVAGKIVLQPDAPQECLDEHWLRVFAVSHLYPQAQAYMSVLAGMAQATGVQLPTIDADDLVSSLGPTEPR